MSLARRGTPYAIRLPENMDANLTSAINDITDRIDELSKERLDMQDMLTKLERESALAGTKRVAKMKNGTWSAKDHEDLKQAIKERMISHATMCERNEKIDNEMEYLRYVRWRMIERGIKDDRDDWRNLEIIEEGGEDEDEEPLVGSTRTSEIIHQVSSDTTGVDGASKVDQI
ncbi:hypothetical protein EJ08DRAFT_693436 [Tothia fuscella]|uniref:Uncharacterized protein n=1 Tax=Tothia fuscella TaxID=1048955 RepID=A0A9P4NZ97_9PEZI|nr:hypothetical protein EJ08DRAFT_693436 [Tothia fuscella]